MPADDAVTYRANYEECRAEAEKAVVPFAKAQWVLFAEEWLAKAEAAEDQERRNPETVPAK